MKSALISIAIVFAWVVMAGNTAADPLLGSSTPLPKTSSSNDQSRSTQTVSRPKSLLLMHSVAKPIQEVSITTPSSGTITEIFVEEGKKVAKGRPLILFDQRLSQARIGIAKAEHESSVSSLKTAELESQLTTRRYENMLEAFNLGAATQIELKEAHVRMQQARARYAAAMDTAHQADEGRKLAVVENELRQLVAPFDGVVVRVFAVPGQTPAVNQPLIQIVDATKLRVDMYLPLSKYEEVRDQTSFTLTAESPINRDLEARLVVFDSVIEPATQTIRCVLEIDNQSGNLPSGFRVGLK